ncbi:MAG: hypothetical protein R3Y16_06620 [Rikenellaceae bacterium]
MNLRRYNIELILANALFGVSYSLIVSLLEGRLSTEQIFILQLLFAALLFVGAAIITGGWRRVRLRDLGRLIPSGLIVVYGWSFLTLEAGRHCSAIDIAALSTLGPPITILAAAIFTERRREASFEQFYCTDSICQYYPRLKHLKPRKIRTLALPIALLCGVVVALLRNIPFSPSWGQLWGYLLTTIAVACIAVSTVLVQDIRRRLSASTLLALYFGIGALLLPFLMPHWLVCVRGLFAVELRPSEVVMLLALVSFGFSLPLYLLFQGAQRLTPLHTALYRYIQPAMALGVLAFDSRGPLLSEVRAVAFTLLFSALFLLVFRGRGSGSF